MTHHRERGQTLPLTLGGIVATLIFGFFAVNYANTLRWQVRAQNAADSAAQAILALQTQQFNEMTSILYATAVEEYRIRHLLNGMVFASHLQGGCDGSQANQNSAPRGCAYIESVLEQQYDEAVGRYTADVLTLHQATATMNATNTARDAQALLSQIRNCNTALGGDCSFKYGTPLITTRTDTEAVYMDADAILKPTPGHQTPLASSVSGPGAPPLNTALFAPLQVEIYACATVPSIIPSFFGVTFPPFTAVARGAATPVMVEEDWLQPGAIANTWTKLPYQPPENYLGARVADGSGYDWYNLNFGGNANVAVAGQGFGFTLTQDEFSVYLGWWNSIPIHPFSGTKTLGSMGCAT